MKKGGEYTLLVHDVTTVHGSDEFAYRIVLRNPVAHVGSVNTNGLDSINLRQSSTHELTISTPREEGYDGEFALSVDNLPAGVEALFGTTGSTVILIAAKDAPPTPLPVTIRMKGRPIVNGQPGQLLEVGQYPMMVIK